MKTILKIQYLLLFLFSCFLMTGCLSDGDETIALEQGDAHKMIRGKWRFSNTRGSLPETFKWKEGTIITFYGDGTYTDSNDEDRTRHRWILNEGGDGIKLDDTGFGIDSWGKDHWRFHYPYGSNNPTWRGGLEHEDGPDGYDKPGATPEPEPEPEPEGEYLVKLIKYSSYNGKSYVYTFDYYEDGRIQEFFDGYRSATYTYEYSRYLNVEEIMNMWSRTRTKHSYALDNLGRITDTGSGVFTYDAQGYLSCYSELQNTSNFVWDKFEISRYENDKWAWSAKCNGEANDSNIDLNPFIIGFPRYDWVKSLAPFGFLGKKSEALISTEIQNSADMEYEITQVLRNEHHLISHISRKCIGHGYFQGEDWGTDTFDIDYQFVEIKK